MPVSIRSQLKGDVKWLTKMDVIATAEMQTPWINQLVLTNRKYDSLRICLDTDKHKTFLGDHYTIPILDVLHMKKAKIFTKACLSSE